MRKVHLTWILTLSFLFVSWLGAAESGPEKITNEEAAAVAGVAITKMHLTQHKVSYELALRLLRMFAKQLDPAKMAYSAPELNEATTIEPAALAAILSKALVDADLTFFHDWIVSFKASQLDREEKFINSLKDRKADVTKPVTQEELDAVKDEYPANSEGREAKMLLLARNSFELYKTYMTDDEAFDMTIQGLQHLLDKEKALDPEKDTPTAFLKAFMLALDPHSEYMDAAMVASFRDMMGRNFSGIGIQMRPCLSGAMVTDVIKNFPAWKSGKFGVDDQIIAVDDVSLAGMTLEQIMKRIKGEKGTSVKITLRKPMKPEDKEPQIVQVTLVRDTIELADVRVNGSVYQTDAGPVGYVSLDSFYEGCAADVAKKIKEIGSDKPFIALVLDLRNNGGGYLCEAINLAGLFLHGGPVVAEKNNNRIKWESDPDPSAIFDGPLVIMVNQYSASASEVVTGCLRDYGRAVIVGPTQTFGKGTVQTIMDLSLVKCPGALRVTVQQYFTASGDSVQIKGIQPDIVIPGRKIKEDQLEKSEDGAIPWSHVDSGIPADNADLVKYSRLKSSVLQQLVDGSKKRCEGNKAFDMYKTSKDTEFGKKDLPDPQRDEAVKIAAEEKALLDKVSAVDDKPNFKTTFPPDETTPDGIPGAKK